MKAKNKEIQENEIDISVEDFCARLELEVLHKSRSGVMHISTFNINRPGLQLAGYYEHFSAERVQVIGEMETAFLQKLSSAERRKAVEQLFKCNFPCLVISTVLEPAEEIMQCAVQYDRVVLRSKLRSTVIMNELSIFLNELLAPTETIHGVLMDIDGVGTLLLGKSSIGKSETALELIQRNHRLIADDAVCITRVSDRLIGSSPSIIRHFMEVRGIGIIDVKQMYGAGAVRPSKSIEMVVMLETWDEEKEYDRLGNTHDVYTILDVELPMYTIPVKPGRNLAVILEVAARNHRLKDMGYDTLAELDSRMRASKDKA